MVVYFHLLKRDWRRNKSHIPRSVLRMGRKNFMFYEKNYFGRRAASSSNLIDAENIGAFRNEIC